MDISSELNTQQSSAVKHSDGPSIILAGAGSGKTRTLTYKVLYLLHKRKVPAEKIAMMTFTNKAAREMLERVDKPLGFIGTFHSLGARILRKEAPHAGLDFNFVIYDDNDSESLIKTILKEMKVGKNITPRFVMYKISSAKDNLLLPQDYSQFTKTEQDQIVALAYKEYQQRLKKNNAADFDDLIFKTVLMLRDNKRLRQKYSSLYDYVLVDEFQDTNTGQYLLAKYLAEQTKNITVVGDFSQSIYSWRGADIKNLERFQKDFQNVNVVHLEQNYRSTQNVLNFAYDIIEQNETHPILDLFTENNHGEEVVVKQLRNEEEEAMYVAEQIENQVQGDNYSDFAVLYRMNAQSRVIEEAFLRFGMPYVLIGGTRFYERKEIKDVLSYVRLFINPQDEVSKTRVLKIGKRRFAAFEKMCKELKEADKEPTTERIIELILDATKYHEKYDPKDPQDSPRLENIKELKSVAQQFVEVSSFLEQIALVESEYSENEKFKKSLNGVRMMTMHQAKGLEFPYIFIVGVEEGILPHSRSMYDQHEIEEERRLLYVGCTRARKKLYVTYAQRRFMFGRRTYAQISRFIQDKADPSQSYVQTF